MPIARAKDQHPAQYLGFPWYRWEAGFLLHKGPSVFLLHGAPPDYFLRPIEQGYKRYFPISEFPGISREFAQVNTPDAALGFANRYGWLGLNETGEHQARRRAGEPFGERVSEWGLNAAMLQRGFLLWDMISEKDTRALRNVIHWRENDVSARFPGNPDPPYYFEIPIAHPHQNSEWLRVWKRGDVLGPAKVFLADCINRRLHARASLLVGLDAHGSFKAHARPLNLLAAMWLQLSEVVTGTRILKPCEICGEVMDVTEDNRNKRTHSRCSLRLKMRRYRASLKEKEQANGKT